MGSPNARVSPALSRPQGRSTLSLQSRGLCRIILSPTITDQVQCWKIAGSIAKAIFCQPLLHGRMDNRVSRNPAATPKVHSNAFLPNSWRCLCGSNLRPQLGDPPEAAKGLVLILRERVRRHVRRFSPEDIGFSGLVHSKLCGFCLADHPL